MPPKKIGRYEVIHELGTGGMASVFHAHDPRFRREVAIKLLPKEFLHSRQLKARFQRESQTIASLEHHAIVPVYDTGTQDNQPFLVMRYMGGGSLAARLDRGPLSALDAANLLFRIGSALDFAHSQGVIHRDLKPANVLFDRFGESFLSDFGIAMLEEASLSITRTGSVIGTPAYMSPEQVQGDGKLDFYTDIYSLGIIVFEMLTGKQPYQADTPTKLMMKHVLDPVPRIRDFDPRLPEGADEVVGRAMAKARQARFATAGELAEATRALFGAERRGTGTPAMTVMAHPPARRQVFKTLLPGGLSRPVLKTLLPESLIGPVLKRLAELPPRSRAAVGLAALALLVTGGILAFGNRAQTPPDSRTPAAEASLPAARNTPATSTAASLRAPTAVPAPSEAATSTPAALVTVSPGPTLEPPSPTPDYVWVVISAPARCRFGPSQGFATVGFIQPGELVKAYGKNPEGTWWWVDLPDGSARCWVSGALVSQPVSPFLTPTSKPTASPPTVSPP
ncbi:MAG: protein kinase domain-containing protein [Anaerolineales bacterium]